MPLFLILWLLISKIRVLHLVFFFKKQFCLQIKSPIANIFVEHLVRASYHATLLEFSHVILNTMLRGPRSRGLFYKVNDESKAKNGEIPS